MRTRPSFPASFSQAQAQYSKAYIFIAMASTEESTDVAEESPEYLREITELKFQNISIKGYEKKAAGGFTREEYYAYRIVSILTNADSALGEPAPPPSDDRQKRKRQEVWRRYSEFEALRIFLCTIYPHCVVPPLPEKAIKGSSGLLSKITFTGEDTDFLMKRQQALELFLVRLSRHPQLSLNVWFHQFMHNIGWREAVQKSGYSNKAESLLQSLSFSLSKQKADSRFEDVKQYSDELETTFKALLDIRQRINTTMTSVYKVHSNYGRVFSEWSEIEDCLGTSLQIAGGCMDSYSESVDMYMDEEETRYYLPLKEYVAYCESLRVVVRRQEALQRHVEKCEEVLSSKAEAKEALAKENPETGGSGGSRFSFKVLTTKLKGGDTSYFGRMSAATRDLQEAEDSAKQAQKDLELFTAKALSELERFHSQKDSDFKSILINYVQLQAHIHRKGITTWERFKQGFEMMS
ncbi:sorting nexin-4-like [Halichondria panicea]|uniref:sorting nexin-4-like n=1 Tax=Halichondria panicea TaxID=6063 RepID=UPI00312B8A58